ncbi:hypothetical protein G6L32_14740 [Agrobacterium tumefaciens]|uniref:hypothetical protein n=1 Tax=Agrobacterium tumefaciens TaxID=358 RepID=UPI0015744C67|nr:hypothetical protein [Agrobacterium tumefaciens]
MDLDVPRSLEEVFLRELIFCRRFDLLHSSVLLESDDPKQIEVVCDYLLPYLVSSGTPAPAVSLKAVHDVDVVSALNDVFAQMQPVGQLSHHPDTNYECRQMGRDRIYLSRKGFPHLIVVRGESNFCVVTSGGLDPESYKPALRLVRELFVRNAEFKGGLSLHASAASIDGAGYVFVGNSGAGKTSLAMAVARSTGGSLLSSDRAMLLRNASGYDIIPWPMVVNIGLGACRAAIANPGYWEERLTTSSNAYFHSYNAPGEIGPLRFSDGDKYALTPMEAREFFSIDISARAALKAVVFPELLETQEQYASIRELSENETCAEIEEQLRTTHDRTYPFGIVACTWRDTPEIKKHWDDLITNVIQDVRCLKLQISKPLLTTLLRDRKPLKLFD